MKHRMYAGTWSLNGQGGIGIYEYESETGEAKLLQVVREDIVAGLMEYDADRKVLYVIDERADAPGIGGRVFALQVNTETGELTELNRQSSFGTLPAYVTKDGSGKGIIICNHNSGTAVSHTVRMPDGHYELERVFSDTTIVHYPLSEDGRLEAPDSILTVPPERNFYACMHSVHLAPDGKTIIACDRNMDLVRSLVYDSSRRELLITSLLPLEHGSSMKTGACPRYSAFHPTLPIVYVNGEYTPRLFTIDYSNGLKLLADMDITPDNLPVDSPMSWPSDLAVTADGKTLYNLYRKTNCVGVFTLDEKGIPAMTQTLFLEGKGPRGCRISPDGRFLLVANLETCDIETLSIYPDGHLEKTGNRAFGQNKPGNLVII